MKNGSGIILRPATKADIPVLHELYSDTITEICKNDYNLQQLKVWKEGIQNTERWEEAVAEQFFIVALLATTVVGFASLKEGYYVDFLYVHKNFQKRGIATTLLNALEEKAEALGTKVTTSDVSRTARPFFEKSGFKVVQRNIHVRNGIEIDNYHMIKE